MKISSVLSLGCLGRPRVYRRADNHQSCVDVEDRQPSQRDSRGVVTAMSTAAHSTLLDGNAATLRPSAKRENLETLARSAESQPMVIALAARSGPDRGKNSADNESPRCI